MQIKSFIDVVSTDQNCSAYTLVLLSRETDLFSGEVISYDSNVPSGASAQNSPEEVQRLRDRITTYLDTKKQIILIDYSREKIFSNIQEDPFFLRIVQNTDYEFKTIDAKRTITRIIEKAFPLPERVEAPSFRDKCTLI
jgi:hypothetical protein